MTLEIFKNILSQINSIHSLLKIENNNKLNDLINIYQLNFQNLNLDEFSKVINEEFEQIKKYIINKDNKINIKDKIIDNNTKNIINKTFRKMECS